MPLATHVLIIGQFSGIVHSNNGREAGDGWDCMTFGTRSGRKTTNIFAEKIGDTNLFAG